MSATLGQWSGSWGLPGFDDCGFSALLTDKHTYLPAYHPQLLGVMVMENFALMSTYRMCVVKEAFPHLIQILFFFLVPLLCALQNHMCS